MKKENIGKRLKSFREKLNFSQDELAKKLNCTQSKIYKIENGLNDINSVDANALQDLGVNLNWLISGKGEMFYEKENLKTFEDIKNAYNLSTEHVYFINQLLEKPELIETLVNFAKNIKL